MVRVGASVYQRHRPTSVHKEAHITFCHGEVGGTISDTWTQQVNASDDTMKLIYKRTCEHVRLHGTRRDEIIV